MAARKRKVTLSDGWRERISVGRIMGRLMECFEGQLELEKVQIDAAKIILSKVVPDLQRSELTGKDGKDLDGSGVIGGAIDRLSKKSRDELRDALEAAQTEKDGNA